VRIQIITYINNHSSLLNLDLIYSLFIRSCIYDACIHAYYCKLVVIFYNMSMLEFWKFTISIYLVGKLHNQVYNISKQKKCCVFWENYNIGSPNPPKFTSLQQNYITSSLDCCLYNTLWFYYIIERRVYLKILILF